MRNLKQLAKDILIFIAAVLGMSVVFTSLIVITFHFVRYISQ